MTVKLDRMALLRGPGAAPLSAFPNRPSVASQARPVHALDSQKGLRPSELADP
jgi:hypothetical protein